MAGMTNRGKYWVLKEFCQNPDDIATFYAALVTAAPLPTPDTNVLADLTEIAAGNGYTAGGQAVSRDAVAWNNLTEDDGNDRGTIQLADITWTAVGGPIPSAGEGARYMVILEDEPVPADRHVLFYCDLGQVVTLVEDQSLIVRDAEIRALEPA